MGKLHRYYLKEVATNAALTFVVVFGIVLVSLVYRGIQKSQGADLVAAAMITLLWTVDTIPHLLMIALLFGIVLTFARAAADREVVAMAGAGIPNWVPMTSAVLLGIVFAIAANLTLHYLIPYAHFHKFRVLPDLARQLILNLGATGDQIQFDEKGIMIWNSRNADDHFQDVVIYSRKGWKSTAKDGLNPGMLLTAREAWIETDYVNDSLRLRLSDVYDPDSSALVGAPWLEFRLREVAEKGRRDEGDKDLASDHLLAEVERGVHENPEGARFSVERRAGFAIMPLLLAPLGFCIGVLARNQGRVTALCFAMLPLFVYYLADLLSVQLVRTFPSPLWGWFPAAVTFVLGAPLCFRIARR